VRGKDAKKPQAPAGTPKRSLRASLKSQTTSDTKQGTSGQGNTRSSTPPPPAVQAPVRRRASVSGRLLAFFGKGDGHNAKKAESATPPRGAGVIREKEGEGKRGAKGQNRAVYAVPPAIPYQPRSGLSVKKLESAVRSAVEAAPAIDILACLPAHAGRMAVGIDAMLTSKELVAELFTVASGTLTYGEFFDSDLKTRAEQVKGKRKGRAGEG
jgi:hypothetical protein